MAFTYNDPVIFAEYAMDTADACHALGLKTVAVTAGYIHAQPRGEFFAKMDAAKVYAIRQHCAPMPGHDDAPGARVCYWAASTVLNAWPSGRAYPESWVNAA